MKIINKTPYSTEPVKIEVKTIPVPHILVDDESVYVTMYPKCDKLRPVASNKCMKFPIAYATEWNVDAYQRITAYDAYFYRNPRDTRHICTDDSDKIVN